MRWNYVQNRATHLKHSVGTNRPGAERKSSQSVLVIFVFWVLSFSCVSPCLLFIFINSIWMFPFIFWFFSVVSCLKKSLNLSLRLSCFCFVLTSKESNMDLVLPDLHSFKTKNFNIPLQYTVKLLLPKWSVKRYLSGIKHWFYKQQKMNEWMKGKEGLWRTF